MTTTADFISTIGAIGQLSEAQAERFRQAGTPTSVKKNALIFMAGKPCLKMWYVKSGMVRAYRIIDGRDITFFFFSKNDFATDYESYLTEQDSPLFLEALTDCELLVFSKRAIMELYELDPQYERLGRRMTELSYLSATARLKQFQTDSLLMRYQKLMSKDPELFMKIPQYHIASYLGVKPQSLSRIKHDLLKQNKGNS